MVTRRWDLPRSGFSAKPPEEGSRRWLVAELDRLTPMIVRRRDRRCVTCGSSRHLLCSHFYSRRHLALRFDLRNCNAMCAGGNRRHNHDPSSYLTYMQDRYGPGVVEELGRLKGNTRKMTDEELRGLLGQLRV